MIKTLAGLLNGALLLAATAAFSILNTQPTQDLALITYAPSVLLALGAGFVAIGGLSAWAAGESSHVRLCAFLSFIWTVVQIGFALLLVRMLLPANWLTQDAAELWIVLAIIGQAALLLLLARSDTRARAQLLKLE